jgi:hypothetical protein
METRKMKINRNLTFYESDGLNPPLAAGTKVELVEDFVKEWLPEGKAAVLVKGVAGYVEVPFDCLSD